MDELKSGVEQGAEAGGVEALRRELLLRRLKQAGTARSGAAEAIPPADRSGPLPLSHAQQRLWFLSRMEGASAAYHIPAAMRLAGPLDRRALERTLQMLVQRHETLRTHFASVDGSPVQVIAERGTPVLRVVDLSALAAREQETQLQRDIKDEVARPFDLATGPLMRCSLFRLGEQAHVLVLTLHHIIADGWSIGVLVREVAALYEAALQSRPNPLPALPLQYADYAQWQRRRVDDPALQRQLDHWKNHLAGAPALLSLPTDRPRPAQQSYAGARLPVRLDAQLSAAVMQLARQAGTTLFMTLQAAWALTLSRLSGQDDVVIGTASANREPESVQGLVGLFATTLPLRLSLAGRPTVLELLAQARQVTQAAFANHDVPFQQMVEALRPERSLGHHPLFQVMLLQNPPLGELKLPGLTLQPLASSADTAQFDLSLALGESGGEITGSLVYASDLFDRTTIERWAGHFANVLRQMSYAPAQACDDIELMGGSERQQVLQGFNATQTPFPDGLLVHQLFESQARRTPDAMALAFGSDTLSYAALNARANRLAHALRERGVGPDVRVGVCAERSLEMVVGLLGVLKAGGAYVPLDPGYPADRLVYMVTDAAPRLVLAQSALLPRLSGCTAPLLALDDEAACAAQPATDPDAAGAQASQLAYVIYTSGSTGQPKGAMNEHRAVVNRLTWMQQAYPLTPEDRVLQKTPFGFDVSVWEFFWPLMVGARLIIARPGGHQDPAYLAGLIESERITVLHFVPSMLQVFLAHGDGQGGASLRHVFCSGEALPAPLKNQCLAALPHAALHNLYGPTEAAVDVSFWRCEPGAPHEPVPIGRPIANLRLYVLDARGRPVPIGVAGEIHIGGVGVGRGYLHRPELTAERFVPDPFSPDPRGRMYRTGDLGRWRADGAIEYLGRNDHQVKIRGLRIELGEIESRLLEQPEIDEAVVVVRDDGAGDQRLVAYVVPPAGVPLETPALGLEALRTRLRQALPDYMLPSAVVPLPALPLSPNGKLDRKALPAPAQGAVQDAEFEPPEGVAEQRLAAIWREVLQIERVGRHDNFFDLGGHSLLAVKVIERVRQAGARLDVASIFTAPTLSALAARIEAAGPAAQPAPPNLIPPGSQEITPAMLPLVALAKAEIDRIVAKVPGGAANVQDIYPLAPLQQGILFHHMLSERHDPYVLPMLMAFDAREPLDALLRALQAAIDRHDILRTAIAWRGIEQPVQVVLREASLRIGTFELEAGRDPVAQLRERMTPQAVRRIDLEQAPLIEIDIAAHPAGPQWFALARAHQIIDDNTSLKLLSRELFALHAGRADLLQPPVPFRDFVAHASSRSGAAGAEAYFRAQLGAIDEPTVLFGCHDVHGNGHALAEGEAPLDAALARRLREAARRSGVSTAALFHAAWGLVAARASGRDEVVFGSVFSGRLQGTPGADRAVGPLINTLPVRLSVGSDNALQWALQAQRALVGLMPHEQTSLALAQRCSSVPAGTPLFNSVLNYRHNDGELDGRQMIDAMAAQGMRLIRNQERTNYPFWLDVDDFGSGFKLIARADEAVSPQRVLGMMQAALASLADALEQRPDAPAATLAVLPPAEREQVLRTWNDTVREHEPPHLVHALIEQQARRSPDAVAVEFEGQALSHGELNERANRLAHHLRGLGVGPDELVAIHVERGLELVVALLGTLKAGGAYVPLDPGYPNERLAYMLQDAKPRAVLTQQRFEAEVRVSDAPVVLLDAHWPEIARQPATDLQPEAIGLTPEHLAYVIYTSGSTGNPKGVMVPHRGVCNLLQAMREQPGLQAHDRLLALTTISFDIAALEIYLPLLCGARLRLASREQARDAQQLAQLVDDWQATVMQATPSTWRMLVSAQWAGRPGLKALCGGEALDSELSAQLRPRVGQLWNVYGPTETTIWSTAMRVDEHSSAGQAAEPIGRPIDNTQIYIFDARQQPVPVGVAGEIHIGGAGVVRGYLRRDALTAERFVADPFGSEAGARLYKTGDLGRWRADGVIEYLGRNDHQVKIRGFRIELGEIEAQLGRHPLVKQAVVVAREDVRHDKRLVAYLTLRDEEALAPDADSLRAHLKQALPDYMLPSAFVVLVALPLTANGKLDRRALPAPDEGGLRAAAYEAPQGETEQALAAVWADTLQAERVGRHDSFFELGGHSLLAMQMVTRVQHALGRSVALRALFESPRLLDFAQRVEAAEFGELGAIEHADRSQPLQLSWAQQRLWFLDQFEGSGAAYHVPGAVRMVGELRLDALEATLQALVDRHETLRTSFDAIDGRPVQRIAAQGPFLLRHTDLVELPRAEAEAQVRRLAVQEIEQRFDLRSGQLVRARLVRLAPQEHVLLLTMHHIISDDWSMDVVVREVAALYTAFAQGRQAVLPPLPVQYADYAQWQRRWLTGDALQRQLEHWKAHLAGAPALLSLPTDRPRPALQSYAGGRVGFTIDAAVSRRLRALAQEAGATLFMTLHAAWAVLLSRLSGQDDVVIGTAVANRQRTEVENLIGFFVNTLALRARLDDKPTVRELLQRTKGAALAAFANQDVPFEQVVEALKPPRSLSHSPVFQVMLLMQNAPRMALQLPGLQLSPLEGSTSHAQFDLTLSLLESGDEISGSFTYASDLFDRETIARWASHFCTLLQSMAEQPYMPVDALPLLPPAGREQVLHTWNDTVREHEPPHLVHALIEQQARRSPAAVAVEFEGQALSHAELNERANRLAHHLRGLGVGPDELVAIHVERGLELVVALLGTLKAGGAYVPLDPGYPNERLAYMLQDAKPRAVLTQQRFEAEVRVSDAPVVLLDAHWPEIARQPATDLQPEAIGLTPEHLAYVIYTSGSTGNPKGVMVPHRGVCNLLQAMREQPGLQAHDRLLALTTISFDIAALEIYLPLLCGARLRLASREQARDAQQLAQLVDDWQATVMQATPSTWRMLVSAQWAGRPGLKALCGGEALDSELSAQLRPRVGQLWNVYGPTETTIWSTAMRVDEHSSAGQAAEPIGRPIDNTQIYIFDARQQPVPVGVAGEIHIGGAGVVRGYLRRDALTAERFVADPFGSEAGARLYKTGDLGRWRADGVIEYLGRNDHQVKIRGFRIELGEIEAQLGRHPLVKQAVVVAREDVRHDKRLVAYLTLRDDAPAEAGGTAHVQQTAALWDEIYRASAAPEAAAQDNFAGWNSSYDGEPMSAAEMQEWRDATVGRIVALRPRRILEIGVGAGLLFWKLLPHCEAYWGTDISQSQLQKLRHAVQARSELQGRVELLQREAADFSGLPQGFFDTVVINSVIQYFPDVAYLEQVLRAAVGLVAPGGSVFVGDVRHLRLLRTFKRAIHAGRAQPEADTALVRRMADAAVAAEEELLLDPAFFPALATQMPRACGVDLRVKAHSTDNELTRHRYDVVLRVEPAAPRSFAGLPSLPWTPQADLRQQLAAAGAQGLRLTGVPNRRLAGELAASRLLEAGAPMAQVQQQLTAPQEVEPAFAEIAAAAGLELHSTWTTQREDGALDLVFARAADGAGAEVVDLFRPSAAAQALAELANDPRAERRTAEAVRVLRGHLQASLPEHMVPAGFVVLPQLPLTPNGKLDRAALPDPLAHRVPAQRFEAPQGHMEERLAAIWREVLGLDAIGRHDSFFDLGGHSLLAVQMVAEVRKRFDREVPVRTLFSASTLALFATALDQAQGNDPGQGSNLVCLRRQGTEPPLFLVHPVGGEIGYARELAAHLDPQVPVYGFAASGFLDGEQPQQSIEAMATRYLAAMQRLRPAGPYRVAGWSAGGTIAYEIARQLAAQGEPAAFVGLIDTPCDPQGVYADGGVDQEVLLRNLPARVSAPQRAEIEAMAAQGDLEAVLAYCRQAGLVSEAVSRETVERHLRVRRAIAEAAQRYRAEPLAQPVALFIAADELRDDPSQGWKRLLADRLQAVIVGGNHRTIMAPPHISALGAALSRALTSHPFHTT